MMGRYTPPQALIVRKASESCTSDGATRTSPVAQQALRASEAIPAAFPAAPPSHRYYTSTAAWRSMEWWRKQRSFPGQRSAVRACAAVPMWSEPRTQGLRPRSVRCDTREYVRVRHFEGTGSEYSKGEERLRLGCEQEKQCDLWWVYVMLTREELQEIVAAVLRKRTLSKCGRQCCHETRSHFT